MKIQKGNKTNEPKVTFMGFKIETDIKEKLQKIAKEDSRSLSSLANKIFKDFIGKFHENKT